MLICNHCNKECKNDNSLRNHERTCPYNPNRKYKNGMTGKTAWNKGLTANSDDRVKKQALLQKGKQKGFKKGSTHSKETKEKISDIMSTKMKNRYTSSKRYYYKGYLLESSWELELAIDLDKNNIKWVRPDSLVYYDDTHQKRRYYPDFYLTDYDVYLDPKNNYVRQRDKQKIKWVTEQNQVKVFLLDKSQLSWSYLREKCYGSTSVSKTESQGSTPCSRAKISGS
jgi:hypothetical protein